MRRKILFLVAASLSLFSVSCKSALETEAAGQFDAWFNESFAKCGSDYFASFDSKVGSIYVNKFGTSANKGLIQLKNLRPERLGDQPVTRTEKLNGVEWHGYWVLRTSQWRFHDGTKWSPWSDMLIIYSDKLSKSLNDLFDRPNSPMTVQFIKREWNVVRGGRVLGQTIVR